MFKKLLLFGLALTLIANFNVFIYAAESKSASLPKNGENRSDIAVNVFIDGKRLRKNMASDAKLAALYVEVVQETGRAYNHFYVLSKDLRPEEHIYFYTELPKTAVEIEITDFDTEIILTDELFAGETDIIAEGEIGFRSVTYEITYASDGDVNRKAVKSETIKQPVKRVERRGIKPCEGELKDGVPLEYLEIFLMESTAYTLDYRSTKKFPGNPAFGITKSGAPARYGIVAVDPSVIPLGTKLYIPGYGFAEAGDIGSAIKGYRIDLFFDTTQEAIIYGRKIIDVYILEYPQSAMFDGT